MQAFSAASRNYLRKGGECEAIRKINKIHFRIILMKCKPSLPPAVVTYGKAEKAKQFAKLFKMCAADKVSEVNTFNRTNLVTLSATGTLAVIYGSKVVFNLYCAFGTVLLALHTTDTAVGANLTNLSALIGTGAFNNNS